MSRTWWSNWAGNQRCECCLQTANGLEDLKDKVKSAADAGKRVRAAGGSYSWSELVPSRDVIIQMHKLKKLIDFDEQAGTVEVEAGMTIGCLDKLVSKRGFTLVSPPVFPWPTVGGVIATASHGTGFAAGNFSDQIEELKIVRADGSEGTVRRGDADYPAAKVALGTLGIVYSVKLKVVPQFNVYVDIRRVPVRYVLEEFEDLQKSCDFLELFYYPLQDEMWLYLMDRTLSFVDRKTWWTRLRIRLDTWFEQTAAGRLIPWVAVHAPNLIPALNWLASRLANTEGASVQTASDAFHYQKAYVKNWDLSYAVPADQAARAWGQAISLVEEYARAGLYPVTFALHSRFTGPSDAWLATEYDRPTCYIEVVTAPSARGYKDFYRELEKRWLAIPGARPHWGKLFEASHAMRNAYPRMQDFLDVRQRWDPNRVFLNEYLEKDVFQI